ncbi:MAG: thioredoxin family protein [Melioribacteraceae bacterium]|nr:thioredoxin family protein [Melioribacteraceae bacterium]MCF8431147.1 thioredoxin family protein [Melioribacteraceae bacterium]
MNKSLLIVFLMIISISLTTMVLANQPEIGKKAPDFTLTDSNGKTHSLTDFAGKYVVLEWINFGCPFVKKHYNSGNMQKLQKQFTEKDVVWLSICSSAEGEQGNFENEEINSRLKKLGAAPSAYLIDESGTVGKAYGAKTTPHMYIINQEGILEYAGAIDDIRSTDVADIERANNYVSTGLNSLINGSKPEVTLTKSYGCAIKY